MNIALTSLYLPSGSKIGVGYQVHGLANALVGRGHRVTVFSPCPRPDGAAYDVQVVPPGRRMRTFGFAWDLRQIDFRAFDVLNAHGDDWFLWGTRRPRHVHTYHGSCLAEMWNIGGLKEKLRMGMLAVLEQQSVLLPDETVAVSENTRKYVKGIRHVIPCGVDVARLRPGLASEKLPKPTILFVGTMHGRKRGRWLLDVFAREVRKAVPDAELWCVCDRPADLDVPAGVTFFGRVDDATLADLFRRAWVFCLPSTYEGFGVPYIEAMASGLPVVATPNPGSLEVTRQGRDGRVVPDQELGSTLSRLLERADERSELRDLGLQRSGGYSWDNVCITYERVFRASPEMATA